MLSTLIDYIEKVLIDYKPTFLVTIISTIAYEINYWGSKNLMERNNCPSINSPFDNKK